MERVFQALIVHMALFALVLNISRINSPTLPWYLFFYTSCFILICIERIVLRKIIQEIRSTGKNSCPTILVGNGNNLVEIANSMQIPSYGYKILGFFSDEDNSNFPKDIRKLGGVKDVTDWLMKNKVEEVYCGLPSSYGDSIVKIINHCENNMIRFFSVPNLRNYLRRSMMVKKFGDVLILAIRNEPLSNLLNRLVKRSMDVILSSLFLCTLYPIIYVIIGSIIKLTSKGSVYFKQERTGLNGKNFRCIKFRSMDINRECNSLQATKNDPRITEIGKFIRRTNIDELPQFINVWKGEMSVVGPRPHMLKHTAQYSELIDKYMVRQLVKPGITGWAQVSGFRGETQKIEDMENRVKCDIWYIENWTPWLDIFIMLKTIFKTIKGDKNAY